VKLDVSAARADSVSLRVWWTWDRPGRQPASSPANSEEPVWPPQNLADQAQRLVVGRGRSTACIYRKVFWSRRFRAPGSQRPPRRGHQLRV